MWMKTLPAITALFLVAACSDDSTEANNSTGSNNEIRVDDNNRSSNNASNNSSSNNGALNNGSSNNTAGTNNTTGGNNTTGTNNSTTGNNTTTNNTTGSNNGVGIVEGEPNDDRATANVLSFGDAVSGVLEAGGEDTFALTATAGQILEIEILAAASSLNISMFLEGATSGIGDRRFDFDNVAGLKRQYFLPKNDTWYVTLQSLEAIDWDYKFVVRQIMPAPMTNAFAAAVAGDLNDGAVDVYELPVVTGKIVARLEAERLAAGSDLDSVMYVYSPTVGFVTFNDDASTSTDSELNFTALTGTTYWLVVDAWRLGAANPYELTIQIP